LPEIRENQRTAMVFDGGGGQIARRRLKIPFSAPTMPLVQNSIADFGSLLTYVKTAMACGVHSRRWLQPERCQ
jgi:hypothetical protein